MITINNIIQQFYQDSTIHLTSDYMDSFSSIQKSKILKVSNFTEFNTYNPNKKYYGINLTSSVNANTIPIGVASEVNILKTSSTTKSVLCSSQYSVTTRSETLPFYNFVTYFDYSDQQTFYNNLSMSKYCLSPHGDFPDCYRHWEAMYLNCIPITLKHVKLEPFYDMPILFLDSWDQLTETLLLNNYDTLMSKPKTKLDLNYWVNLIKG